MNEFHEKVFRSYLTKIDENFFTYSHPLQFRLPDLHKNLHIPFFFCYVLDFILFQQFLQGSRIQ